MQPRVNVAMIPAIIIRPGFSVRVSLDRDISLAACQG
jgi:hypothetical protein